MLKKSEFQEYLIGKQVVSELPEDSRIRLADDPGSLSALSMH
jgi:hypothetical protein